MSRITSVAVGLLVLLPPATATATQRYASPTGSGTACTQVSPCSIATATSNTNPGGVNPGDEIILLSGTYPATAEIDIQDDNVTLRGDTSGPRPTIQSNGATAVSSNHTGTSISHLNIDHTGIVQGISLFVGNGTVDDVVVRSTGTACSFGSTASSVFTVRNTICATSGGGTTGINLTFGNVDLTLRNVTAIATGTINTDGLRADSDAGETMVVTGTNVIANTLATDAPSQDIAALSNGAGASSTITLDHSNYADVFSAVGGMGGSSTVTPAGTNGNQTSPPVFVNTGTGDFHQTSGSPTIDAGADNVLNGSTDIDGDPRPDGLRTDIGADEFPDADDDDDGVADNADNCPTTPNANQANNDGDAQGDVCDSDDDNDTVNDGTDNCQFVANPNQANNDGDSQGDACDPDDDNDSVSDATDNCQFAANADQANNDGDAQGDVCDSDDDNDTVEDGTDNCPTTANADQANGDGDLQGNACDADDDNDGVLDASDNCPLQAGVATNGGCPLVLDTDPPETEITKGPAEETTKTTAKFKFTSDEANSAFQCKLDREQFEPCTSPKRYRHLEPGKHKFRVRAVDAAGNRDPTPAKMKWRVLEG